MLMMKSSGRKASIVVYMQYACGSAGLHSLSCTLVPSAHTWFWAALFALGRSALAAYHPHFTTNDTAGCLYVRLKMTDNECATLPSRNQCESGNHNNSPLSPGVDMLDPAKLQHVVVSQQRSECCQTYTPPCSSYPEDYISCRGYIVLSKELRWHTRRKGTALSCGAVHVCATGQLLFFLGRCRR